MIGDALDWLGAAALVVLIAMFEVVAYFAPIFLQVAQAVLLYLIHKSLRTSAPVTKIIKPKGIRSAPAGASKELKFKCTLCGDDWPGSRSQAGLVSHKRVRHPDEYAAEKLRGLGRNPP